MTAMNSMAGRGRRHAGFTLVEALIAMMVLTVGLSATLLTITFANKTAYAARNQAQAVQRARHELEQYRPSSFSATNLSNGTHTRNRTNYLATIVIAGISTNMKSVTVNVPWTNTVTRLTATASVSTIFCEALH